MPYRLPRMPHPENRVEIPQELLKSAQSLHSKGLYVQAAQQLEPFKLPATWAGLNARIFGGRLAQCLGAPRLAKYLFISNFRQAPHSENATLYFAYLCFQTRGPWGAWEILRHFDTLSSPSNEIVASAFALRACICATFLDAENALSWLDKAHGKAPNDPWIWTEQSVVLKQLDDTDGALEAVQNALSIQPWFPPAVQQCGQLLLETNQDEKALALFEAASNKIQSATIIQQWIGALSEREEVEAIPTLCNLALQHLPWAEPDTLDWFTFRKLKAYSILEKWEEARALTEQIDCNRCHKVAQAINDPAHIKKRVKLHVPFVKQATLTCAPASLTSLAAYWNLDASHQQIIEAICYGGTYSHALRRWAEEQNWVVREFAVSWHITRELIDRGIPFLLQTIDVDTGHIQVIEGYDTVWNTILIRDPNLRHYREIAAPEFFERYQAFGPRGLIILPRDEQNRIENLDLPETDAFDCLHRINLALEKHNRDSAYEEFQRLRIHHSSSILTHTARLTLACYDSNTQERLCCLEAMKSANLRHPRITSLYLDALKDFEEPQKHRSLLESLAQFPQEPDAIYWDPSFWLALANELIGDNRNHFRTKRLLTRYHALCPQNPRALSLLAQLHWKRCDQATAVELLRFAATVADTQEEFATEYYQASRSLGQGDNALKLLADRSRRYQTKSRKPLLTYYDALRQSFINSEASKLLDTAVENYPNDGELIAFAAFEHATTGDLEKAQHLLKQSTGLVKSTQWLRTAAGIAALSGKAQEEIACWQQITSLEPFALDAHSHLIRLTTTNEGFEKVVLYWQNLCQRFPHHAGFRGQLALAALHLGDSYAEPYVKSWRDITPNSPTPQIEYIRILVNLGRIQEANDSAIKICHTHPHLSHAWFWNGQIQKRLSNITDACNHYRRAIELDVDNIAAIEALFSATPKNKQQEFLTFVEFQLQTQHVYDHGVFAWVDAAKTCLSDHVILTKLSSLRKRHPNLWSIWSASVRYLIDTNRLQEALALARKETERFSLLAHAWIDLSLVQQHLALTDNSITSLQQAYILSPNASGVYARLALALKNAQRHDEAINILLSASRRNSCDPILHATLATIYREKDASEQALKHIKIALTLDPTLDWVWDDYASWSLEDDGLEFTQSFYAFVQTTVNSHPSNTPLRLTYARFLIHSGRWTDAHHAIEYVLAKHPQNLQVLLLKIDLFIAQNRFHEALEICRAPIWNENPPTAIENKSIWITYLMGKQSEAIEKLRSAVSQDPKNVWAWQTLSKCLAEDLDIPGACNAACRAAALQPKNGDAWHQWALLEENSGNHKKALQILKEIPDRDPSYTPAIFDLTWKLIESGNRYDAINLLTAVNPHLSKTGRLISTIIIDLNAQRITKALTNFSVLIKSHDLTPQLLAILGQISYKLEALPWLNQAIDSAISLQDTAPAVAVFWTEQKLRQGRFNIIDRLTCLPNHRHAKTQALRYYFEHFPIAQQPLLLGKIIRKHRKTLQQDDSVWGLIAAHLLNTNRDHEAYQWTSCWRAHPNAKRWDLQNAAIAALCLGYLDEAFAISQHARTLPSQNGSWILHSLIMALHCTLCGKIEDAQHAIDSLRDIELTGWKQEYYEVTQILLKVKTAPSKQERKQQVKALKKRRATTDCSQRLYAQLFRFSLKATRKQRIQLRPLFAPPPSLVIAFSRAISSIDCVVTSITAFFEKCAQKSAATVPAVIALLFLANVCRIAYINIKSSEQDSKPKGTPHTSPPATTYNSPSKAVSIDLTSNDDISGIQTKERAADDPWESLTLDTVTGKSISIRLAPSSEVQDLPGNLDAFLETKLEIFKNNPPLSFDVVIHDTKGRRWVCASRISLDTKSKQPAYHVTCLSLTNTHYIVVEYTARKNSQPLEELPLINADAEKWINRLTFNVD